ncbi:MAG TPA: hypothetical protein VFU21_20345 [Kofleriaceae bacterium]|nr:hypothetical protein [Kofleriaceae bacterium]
MTTAGRLALVAALVAAAACKGKKEKPEERPPAQADPAVPRSPASEPDLPDPLSLDCARIVPDEVRAAHLAGLTLVPTVRPPIATCAFQGGEGTAQASVSLFCHRRKRNWNFADELARDRRKTGLDGVGRAAYTREDHVFFYPSKLDCLARVIAPGDPAKAAALARAVDAHLSKATVTAAPR